MSVSQTARSFYLILNCLSRTFLIFLKHLVFRKIKAEKEGFEPSRRVNDLLPFQGSPFGQLGYFSKLPYLLSSSDIYLCRSQRQVILYLVSFMLSSTFFTFLKSFYSVFDKRREWDSNPRALADKRFSRPPRYDHFDTSPCFAPQSVRDLFYHQNSSLSTIFFTFFDIFCFALKCIVIPGAVNKHWRSAGLLVL